MMIPPYFRKRLSRTAGPLCGERGITMTELLITVAILGILVSVVGTFLIQGLKFSRLTQAKGEIQRDARLCVDLINRNLRQGSAGSVTISRFNSTQPPCSMIQFAHINGDLIRYFQTGPEFHMSTSKDAGATWSNNTISDTLRHLSFSYPRIDNSNIISVSLCFEKATYQGASKVLQLSVEKVRIMNP